jgi:DNA-binding CsgD family transcriptional regulator
VVPGLQQADVMAWPQESQHEKYQAAFARHMHEHPLIGDFQQTGDLTAIKISDFFSRTQHHDTGLYDEMHRHLNYEDQFALNLFPPGPQWVAVVVARDRRTFRERDRDVLNLLRGHLAQAYRQARAISRLMDRLDARRTLPTTSRMKLDGGNAIVCFPARAQRWIARYFNDLPHAPRRLPEPAERWLAQARSVSSESSAEQIAGPLVVRLRGRKLVVRLLSADDDGRTELLLEERTDSHSARELGGLRLTPRELDVLLEVEKGKHNSEIAAELGLQPLTVKKHLENIFDKLGVDNRTAAVAQLRRTGIQFP